MVNFNLLNQGISSLQGTLSDIDKQQRAEAAKQQLLVAVSKSADMFEGLGMPGAEAFAKNLRENPQGAMAVAQMFGGAQNFFKMLGDERDRKAKQLAIGALLSDSNGGVGGAVDPSSGMRVGVATPSQLGGALRAGLIDTKEYLDILNDTSNFQIVTRDDGSMARVDKRTGRVEEIQGPDPQKLADRRLDRQSKTLGLEFEIQRSYERTNEAFDVIADNWLAIVGAANRLGVDDLLTFQNTVIGLVKSTDPISIVRETEYARVIDSQDFRTMLKSLERKTTEGKADPVLMHRMLEAIRGAVKAQAQITLRSQEAALSRAKQIGVDGERIIDGAAIADPRRILETVDDLFEGEPGVLSVREVE